MFYCTGCSVPLSQAVPIMCQRAWMRRQGGARAATPQMSLSIAYASAASPRLEALQQLRARIATERSAMLQLAGCHAQRLIVVVSS